MNPQIENNFRYQVAKPGQSEIYSAIREKAKELAYLTEPNSHKKSLAMTKVKIVVKWVNVEVARN